MNKRTQRHIKRIEQKSGKTFKTTPVVRFYPNLKKAPAYHKRHKVFIDSKTKSDKELLDALQIHEMTEHLFMEHGYTYEQAHKIALRFERMAYKDGKVKTIARLRQVFPERKLVDGMTAYKDNVKVLNDKYRVK